MPCEVLPLPYQSLDERGCLICVTPAWGRVFGYAPEEVIGRLFGDLIAPGGVDHFASLFSRLEKGEEIHGVALEVVRKDGQQITVEFDGKVEFDEKDRFRQAHCILRDVTERKRTEQYLRFLSSAVEQTSEGVAVADLQGRVLFSNEAFARMHGYRPEELVGKHLSVFHVSEQMPAVEAANGQAKETGVFTGEIGHKRRDGTVFAGWMRNTLLRDEAGAAIGVIGTLRDISEEKRTREALIAEQGFTEAVIDSSPSLFYVFDSKGHFRRWNKNLEQVSGYSAEEIATMTALDFFTEEDAVLAAEAVRIVFEQGENTLENDLLTKDGRKIPHHFTGVRTQINGEPYLVGMAIDVSSQKKTKDKLRHERDRYKQIINSLPGLFYVFDEERFVQWNPRWEVVTRYSSEELGERYGPDFFENTDKVLAAKQMEATFREGAASVELELVTKDGQKIPYFFTGARCVFDGVPHLVGMGIDITVRKRAEEELARTRTLLESVMRQSPIPMVVATPDGALSYNIAAKQYLLGSENDPDFDASVGLFELKRSWKDYDRDGNLVPLERLPLALALHGEITRDLEWRIVRKDGSERWESVHAGPIHGDDGTLIAGFLSFLDITDRKRAEAEREELITTLEAQNAELERFTYTVSHDLKSPLITIKGYVGILREDLAEGATEAVAKNLDQIAAAADRMNRLLSDLLELSRIGRLVNPPEEVPLGELVDETLRILHGQIERAGVDVIVSPDLPMIFGDRVRLLEVTQNLIDNAVKHMGVQPKPRIEIGVREEDDEIICFVRDNGVGIESMHRERVFGLFEQLDPGVEGSGIGLALVKRIVELHGGRVWFESEGLGHGTTFCFTVPPKPEATQ